MSQSFEFVVPEPADGGVVGSIIDEMELMERLWEWDSFSARAECLAAMEELGWEIGEEMDETRMLRIVHMPGRQTLLGQ